MLGAGIIGDSISQAQSHRVSLRAACVGNVLPQEGPELVQPHPAVEGSTEGLPMEARAPLTLSLQAPALKCVRCLSREQLSVAHEAGVGTMVSWPC